MIDLYLWYWDWKKYQNMSVLLCLRPFRWLFILAITSPQWPTLLQVIWHPASPPVSCHCSLIRMLPYYLPAFPWNVKPASDFLLLFLHFQGISFNILGFVLPFPSIRKKCMCLWVSVLNNVCSLLFLLPSLGLSTFYHPILSERFAFYCILFIKSEMFALELAVYIYTWL
jgi:hypothetical protein